MAEANTPLLSLRGLTRRFGGLTAVDGMDLDLAKGGLVSIIGPNGARARASESEVALGGPGEGV